MTPIALWLVPAEPWRTQLAQCIDALARRHAALPFEPHISLHVGQTAAPQEVPAAMTAWAARLKRLTLVAGVSGHSAEHYKTLFVSFDDARLHELQPLAARALGLSTGYALRPHLSLLYRGGLPESARAALAREVNFAGAEWVFDTLVAVRSVPGRDFSDQRDWLTDWRCSFAG